MKLSEYAKRIGVTYKTAWNHYKAGQIPNARKLPSGTIVIDDYEHESRVDRLELQIVLLKEEVDILKSFVGYCK